MAMYPGSDGLWPGSDTGQQLGLSPAAMPTSQVLGPPPSAPGSAASSPHQNQNHIKARRQRGSGASNRSSVACDSCHKSKKKCDGNHPCHLCSRNGRQCVYTPKQPRKKVSRAEYISLLESRLRAMEHALTDMGKRDVVDRIGSTTANGQNGVVKSEQNGNGGGAGSDSDDDDEDDDDFDAGAQVQDPRTASYASMPDVTMPDVTGMGMPTTSAAVMAPSLMLTDPLGHPAGRPISQPRRPSQRYADASVPPVMPTTAAMFDPAVHAAAIAAAAAGGGFPMQHPSPPSLASLAGSGSDPSSTSATPSPAALRTPDYAQLYLQSLFPETLATEDLAALLYGVGADANVAAAARARLATEPETHLFSNIRLDGTGVGNGAPVQGPGPGMGGKKRRVDGTTAPGGMTTPPMPTTSGPLVGASLPAFTASGVPSGTPTHSPHTHPHNQPNVGSPPATAASSSDGSEPADALSQAIRLRDHTTYFDAAAKARYRGRQVVDVIDFAIEDFVTATEQTVRAPPGPGGPAGVMPVVPGSPAAGALTGAGAQSMQVAAPGSASPLLGSPVAAVQDVAVAALAAELERLGMNPSQYSLGLMRRITPSEQPRADLLAAFFGLGWAPAIHSPTFYHALPHQSPLLLNAIYALAASIVHGAPGSPAHPGTPSPGPPGGPGRPHEGEIFFNRARRLLTVAFEEACLSTVLALLFMALYATGSGRMGTGWMYGGMAVRMVLELKWHEQPDAATVAKLHPLEYELRKRAWWLCFVFDTASAVIAGRPSFVDPDEPMVDFPDDDVWNSLDAAGNPLPGSPAFATWQAQVSRTGVYSVFGINPPAATVNGGLQHVVAPSRYFREISEVTVIFGRIAKYVRAHKSRRTTIGLVDERLSALDMQLKEFWAGLSDKARTEYMLRVGEQGRVEGDVEDLVGNGYLHMMFHSATILLHRPELTLQDFVWPTRASFDVCTYAADRIAIIVDRMMAADVSMSHVSPALTFPIFEAGMVHLVNALVSSLIPASPSHPGAPAAPSNELMDRARRSVTITLRALDKLRRYWGSAEAYYSSLLRAATDNGIIVV